MIALCGSDHIFLFKIKPATVRAVLGRAQPGRKESAKTGPIDFISDSVRTCKLQRLDQQPAVQGSIARIRPGRKKISEKRIFLLILTGLIWYL